MGATDTLKIPFPPNTSRTFGRVEPTEMKTAVSPSSGGYELMLLISQRMAAFGFKHVRGPMSGSLYLNL